MPGLGKKIDMDRVVEKYLSRLEGKPDATRLLLNMLADNVTDITKIRNYIIRHEFRASSAKQKQKQNRATIIEKLSETYGLSKREIMEIVGE